MTANSAVLADLNINFTIIN